MQRYNIKIFAGEKMGKITHSYKKTLPLNPLPAAFFCSREKLSEFGLTDGTLAPVLPVIKLLAGTALPFSFFPLLRCGTSFHRALGEGSSPPEVP
jgi:hypothetical protein